MSNFRIVLSGMSRSASGVVKNSIISNTSKGHSDFFKAAYFSGHGVRLAKIDLRVISLLDESRDFKRLVGDAGFPDSIPKELRILVSDNGYDSLPELSREHPLLCAMQISDRREVFPSNLNVDVVGFSTTKDCVTSDILLIALDIAYANSGFPAFIRKAIGVDSKTFMKEKANFAIGRSASFGSHLKISEGAPYVPFSAMAFPKRSPLDNREAIDRFLLLWDEFITQKLSAADSRDVTIKFICGIPKIGRQIPREKLAKLIKDMEPGVYLFAIRVKSKKIASQSTKNALYAAFTSLKYFRVGAVDFGFIRADGAGDQNNTLTNLRRLEQEGAVYLTRVVI